MCNTSLPTELDIYTSQIRDSNLPSPLSTRARGAGLFKYPGVLEGFMTCLDTNAHGACFDGRLVCVRLFPAVVSMGPDASACRLIEEPPGVISRGFARRLEPRIYTRSTHADRRDRGRAVCRC
jgi:hypothetical protein